MLAWLNVVRARRSSSDTCAVVGAARRVPFNGVLAACIGLKRETLDQPVASVSVKAPCKVAGCPKRSTWAVDRKQATHCLDHASVEEGPVEHSVAAVETVGSKEGSRPSPSIGPSTHFNGNGNGSGTAAKRTRYRLYHRYLPPPQEMTIQI